MRPSALGAFLVATLWAGGAAGFWEAERGPVSVELRGNIRVNQTLGRSAPIEGLPMYATPPRELSASFGLLRLMADAALGTRVALEFHALGVGSAAPTGGLSGLADGFDAGQAGRSAALSWHAYRRAGTAAEVVVDRAAVKIELPFGQLVVGRQPVNLATTSFFTPNDLFQPFSAQAFFRLYKPGVDAARLEADLGEVSQLSVLSVLGYRESQEGGRAGPTWDASASLVRASTAFWDAEWAVIGGKAPHAWMAGLGVQGELADWLGVRVEGHVMWPLDETARTRAELAVGLEHRFEGSLDLRLEYFYNGSGEASPDRYAEVLLDPVARTGTPYLGRHFAAAGAAYELTPLLSCNAFALMNLTDGSFQIAAALAYSLLEDVDLQVVTSLPVGDGVTVAARPDPSGLEVSLGSELGAAPSAISAELRAFF